MAIKYLILSALLCSCATQKTCPPVATEKVSQCRAESACGGKNASLRILGNNLGARPNSLYQQHELCVEENLKLQRDQNEGTVSPDRNVQNLMAGQPIEQIFFSSWF